MLRAKALAGVVPVQMTAAPWGVASPVEGVIVELSPYCAGFSG